MPSRGRLRALLGLTLFGAIILAAVAFGPEKAVETLIELRGSPWLVPLLFGLYLLRPFIGWPHSPFPVAAGFYFELVGGTVVAVVGLVLTTLPPFWVGRYLRTGTDTEADADVGAFEQVSDLGYRFRDATGDGRSVVGARLLPIPADLVSYGAGVAGVRPRAFLLGTLIGDVPWAIGLVFVGTRLEELTVEEVKGLDPVVVALLALIGLGVLGKPLYARLRG